MDSEVRLSDSELQIMDVLWDEGECKASDLVKILAKKTGWNRNTTYTIAKKCVAKGAVKRIEPGFHCHPMITRSQVQRLEMEDLLEKLFQGNTDQFLTCAVEVTRGKES